MTAQKNDITMDDTTTALGKLVEKIEKLVKDIEKITEPPVKSDFFNKQKIEKIIKPPVMPDFLYEDNINKFKGCINNFKDKHLLIAENDLPLYIAHERINKEKKNEYTANEIKIKLQVATIEDKQKKRKKLIDRLNQTTDNIFITLNKHMPYKLAIIDTIKQEWIDRNYYVEVQSSNLIFVKNILNDMFEYLSDYIIKDKTLPNLLKQYNMQTDILDLAKQLLIRIKNEQEYLSHAMLLRLQLARLNLPDDTLLATAESLRPYWNFSCYNAPSRYFFDEVLSPALCIQFYNYIQTIGNEKHIKTLQEIYSITCVDVKQMASFIKNNNINFPFYEGFTWNKMDFTKIRLPDAVFNSGCIKNSCLLEGNFIASDFTKCTIANVNAKQTNFKASYFNDATCKWIYAAKAIFTACDLSRALFHGSNLCEANFRQAILNKTDFSMTNLRKASFFGVTGSCNFDSADLTEANLSGVDISRMSFKDAILIDTQFIASSLEEDILLELNVLACRIERHPAKAELLTAIKNNVINKIISMPQYQNNEMLGLEESKLLQHALFAAKDDSMITQFNNQAYSFFKRNSEFIPKMSLKGLGI